MSSYGSIQLVPSTGITYVSNDTLFTPTTTNPTDVWTMYGSATKTIKILYLGVLWKTGTSNFWYLIKRSTTNTGGTSTSTTPTKLDSNNPAATATILNYTANPSSLGTSQGVIVQAGMYPFATAQSNTYLSAQNVAVPAIFNASQQMGGQPIILRGTSEGIALNLNGVAGGIGGQQMAAYCVWIEE